MANKTTYQDAMQFAMQFLQNYGADPKLAEDPNRPALVPDDMKEGKPQTDEVDKGDGNKQEQGAPGKETAEDVAKMEPDGASVEGDRKNTGDSAEGIIKNPPTVSTSEEPKDDIDKMDNVDPAFKKAYASYLKLSNGVIGLIDDTFNEAAEKNASDDAVLDEIVQSAINTKAQHIDFLVHEFGVSPKQANDMLNQLADQDPTAVLPPEAISDEEAEQVLADAAAADAGAPAPEAAPEGGDDVDADIQQFIEEMQGQGYSDDEIMAALEQAADIVGQEEGGAAAPEGEVAPEAAKAASDPTEPGAAEVGGPGEAEAAAAPAPEAAPEGGDMGNVEGELSEIVSQLQDEGYSQEDIAQALMEELDISPDEIVDTVMQDLQSKGFTEEEAGELLSNLGELEQQGVTPEQFAQVIDQLQ